MNIKLKNVDLTLGKSNILSTLNLEFSSGEISTILGRSGSGKTSLLKIIAGLMNPTNGKVYFNDQDVTDLRIQDRNIGWVPQQQLIFPGLNVYDNIRYGLKTRKRPKEEQKSRVQEIAQLIGLADLLERNPQGLSGGEKQRVAIARALAPNPDILLLDEPFSSLDAPERDRLSLVVRNIQLETGITTAYVTHSSREAELISDIVFILSEGNILQSGTIEDIQIEPKSVEVAKLLNLPNIVQDKSITGSHDPIIISSDAIEITKEVTDIPAKILNVTTSKYYLQINNDLVLEKPKLKSENYSSRDEIYLKLDKTSFRKLG